MDLESNVESELGSYTILPHDIYFSWRPTRPLNFFVVREADVTGNMLIDGEVDLSKNDICHLKEKEKDTYILDGQKSLFEYIDSQVNISHSDITVVGLSNSSHIADGDVIKGVELPITGKELKRLQKQEQCTEIFYLRKLKQGTPLGDGFLYHFDNKMRNGTRSGHGTLTPESSWNKLTLDDNPHSTFYHLNEDALYSLPWEFVGLFAFKGGGLSKLFFPFEDDGGDLKCCLSLIIESQATLEGVLEIYDLVNMLNAGDMESVNKICNIMTVETDCFVTFEETQRCRNAVKKLRKWQEEKQQSVKNLNVSN